MQYSFQSFPAVPPKTPIMIPVTKLEQRLVAVGSAKITNYAVTISRFLSGQHERIEKPAEKQKQRHRHRFLVIVPAADLEPSKARG